MICSTSPEDNTVVLESQENSDTNSKKKWEEAIECL